MKTSKTKFYSNKAELTLDVYACVFRIVLHCKSTYIGLYRHEPIIFQITKNSCPKWMEKHA